MKKLLFSLTAVVALVGCAEAGVLDANWMAPTTNTDGTPLTDLASYRLYFIQTGTTPPCPGTQFIPVTAAGPSPGPNTPVSQHMTGLTTGTSYTVAVTALNVDGVESACSGTVSANARPTTPAPATGVNVR